MRETERERENIKNKTELKPPQYSHRIHEASRAHKFDISNDYVRRTAEMNVYMVFVFHVFGIWASCILIYRFKTVGCLIVHIFRFFVVFVSI